jgi:hypothetical protein
MRKGPKTRKHRKLDNPLHECAALKAKEKIGCPTKPKTEQPRRRVPGSKDSPVDHPPAGKLGSVCSCKRVRSRLCTHMLANASRDWPQRGKMQTALKVVRWNELSNCQSIIAKSSNYYRQIPDTSLLQGHHLLLDLLLPAHIYAFDPIKRRRAAKQTPTKTFHVIRSRSFPFLPSHQNDRTSNPI